MIGYDDRDLQRLFADMEPRRRKQALKSGFRRAGNRVRKIAVGNLKATGLHNASALAKGIRTVVSKRTAGFRVTIATKKSTMRDPHDVGMHRNRRGLKKPVIIWAESGTDWRSVTNAGQRVKVRGRWVTLGKARGRMRREGFMAKTARVADSTVTAMLHDEVEQSIMKTAKKYGCE